IRSHFGTKPESIQVSGDGDIKIHFSDRAPVKDVPDELASVIREQNRIAREVRDQQIERYYLKAMNCSHHHRIFAAEPRSYRDLPLRLAEYGTSYRYEQCGELFASYAHLR